MTRNFMLILTVSLGLASSAMAMPRIGDYTQFLMSSVDASGARLEMKLESEIISYDAATKEFALRETQTMITPDPGETSTDESSVPETELMNDARIADTLKNCKKQGGSTETIKTAAGSFSACKFTRTIGNAVLNEWYGNVPMGLIKNSVKDDDGGITSMELTAYRLGL